MRTKILFLICLLMAAQSVASKDFNLYDNRGQVVIDIDTIIAPVVCSATKMLSDDIESLDSKLHVKIDRHKPDIIARISSRLTHPEEFRLFVAKNGILHIEGADPHGLAYGLLEVSRIIGVSPWTFWAGSITNPCTTIKEGFELNEYPSVRYRGIFINDEDWGFTPWSSTVFERLFNSANPEGMVGPHTTEEVFKLLLRLRANTYWPPMHECSVPFFMTPGNREVAQKYGIYIGTSHCEPMACNANGEWKRRGTGDYNYVTNAENVRRFWQQRIDEVRNQEMIYTIGMRGVHDGMMQGVKTTDEHKKVLQQVINDQLQMLPKDAPKVFIPYKEVLDVYQKGLQLPDDVTLMWTDDNYGYIRHFPTESEKNRIGGNGIYYHVSYWGRPHDYLWLGTASPFLLAQQMLQAYDHGVRQMWILNVGDIKPAEYQTELFLDLAWNIDKVRSNGVKEHLRQFLYREFGRPEKAETTPNEIGIQKMDDALSSDDITRLTNDLVEHYRLAFIHKPEFMAGTRVEEKDKQRWNTARMLDWAAFIPGADNRKYAEQRMRQYEKIAEDVAGMMRKLQKGGGKRTMSFYHLVQYPVRAAELMNRKFLVWQAFNTKKAEKLSKIAFDSIQFLTEANYNGTYSRQALKNILTASPRSLAVFNEVKEVVPLSSENLSKAVALPVKKETENNIKVWEGLGYGEGTMQLDASRQSEVTFAYEPGNNGKVTVCLAFIPTHKIDDRRLAVSVTNTDMKQTALIDYATVGRSEEWKENVLWNRSLRKFDIAIDKRQKHHSFTVKPLSDGILLDQVYVVAMPDQKGVRMEVLGR